MHTSMCLEVCAWCVLFCSLIVWRQRRWTTRRLRIMWVSLVVLQLSAGLLLLFRYLCLVSWGRRKVLLLKKANFLCLRFNKSDELCAWKPQYVGTEGIPVVVLMRPSTAVLKMLLLQVVIHSSLCVGWTAAVGLRDIIYGEVADSFCLRSFVAFSCSVTGHAWTIVPCLLWKHGVQVWSVSKMNTHVVSFRWLHSKLTLLYMLGIRSYY